MIQGNTTCNNILLKNPGPDFFLSLDPDPLDFSSQIRILVFLNLGDLENCFFFFNPSICWIRMLSLVIAHCWTRTLRGFLIKTAVRNLWFPVVCSAPHTPPQSRTVSPNHTYIFKYIYVQCYHKMTKLRKFKSKFIK